MPIHDQSYRRYGGQRSALGRSWLVIAVAGIKTMIRKRVFLGLLLMSWMQFLFRAIALWFAENVPQTAQLLAPSAETFRDFFDRQGFFVFVVTIYVGAGLIANDRRANALQIYLSKPLLRSEYIAGKAAVLVMFLLAVTWLPGVLLLFLQVMFSGSFQFLRANLFLVPAITVAAVLQALLASFTMLALSSLSKSSRFVGVMYAGLIFFTAALFNAVRGITGKTWLAWLSPSDVMQQLGDVIFRLPPRFEMPGWAAALVVLALIAGSALVLERRVRAVEVVT